MHDALVSLVIPGRNCAATIKACLESVAAIRGRAGSPLAEVIFVDDGSTDRTPQIVTSFSVSVVQGGGRGPGAARNQGWRAAQHPLVWFIDSDCVAEPDSLEMLLPSIEDERVAGVGGSYGIMNPQSLLACLIHEEIVERHLAMSESVNFLATFNVLYRRSVLEALDGFDERYLKGQDAELSFRVIEAGHELRFTTRSRVRHFHETRLGRYLRTQRQQGYWRVWLHLNHAGHATGDSYSSALDHVQPILAMLALGSLPLILVPYGWIAPVACAVLLAAAQLPLTVRLLRRYRSARSAWFAPMSFIRAFWRGIGMSAGTARYLLTARRISRSQIPTTDN